MLFNIISDLDDEAEHPLSKLQMTKMEEPNGTPKSYGAIQRDHDRLENRLTGVP